MATDYIPDLFHRLFDFLQDLIDKPDPSLLPRLRLELDRARPFIIQLFDKRPRNPKEADQIRKGQFVYQSTLHSHTSDFTQEALYLSEQLELSENQCAILLQHGMSRKARYGRPNADNAVIIYYQERTALLRVLKLIFQPTDSENLITSGLSEELERFRNGLISSRSTSVKQDTWVSKVLKEIEHSKNQILKLKAQLTSSSTSNAYAGQSTNNSTGAFNFGSTSTPPQRAPEKSNQVVVKFSDEIVQRMLEQHQSERRELGQIVYLIGFSRLLNKEHLLSLVDILADMNSQDPLICHFLMTFLAAMDGECSSPTDAEYNYLTGLWNDIAFMQTMTERLTKKRWLVRQVKAVALLQWCLFLGLAYQQDPRLEHETQIWEDLIDQMVMSAIHNGAFPFMVSDLLVFKKKDLLEESPPQILGPRTEDALRVATADDLLGIEEGFRSEVVERIDHLMITFVTSLQSVLRRLRNQEEDVHVSMRYHSMNQTSNPDMSESLPSTPHHDIEALFEVIAAIHRNAPDSALVYWGVGENQDNIDDPTLTSGRSTKLTGFVRWASECRQLGMVQSFYEMLASLATGPRCSDLAYSFLMSGSSEDGTSGMNPTMSRIADAMGRINLLTCSWSSIFGRFQYYIQALQVLSLQKNNTPENRQLFPAEVSILKKYAKVIRQIVRYSSIAQATLYDHQKYRPIQTLFALAACPIPLDLKAELLLAIAAFAAPGSKISADIARKCWLTLEHSQILSTNTWGLPADFGAPGALSLTSGELIRTGILAELEEVEATNQVYPGSTAFIRLLVALIHPPARRSPVKKGEELELQSIPENLGVSSRSPGIEPYLRFVVDEVFRKVGSRDFLHQEERYQVFEVCLAFIERCLTSYEIGPFLATSTLSNAHSGSEVHSRAVSAVVTHPGFEIMLRILNNTELTRQLFETLLNGPRFVENEPQKSDITCRCVLRALRIVHRVIELQHPFLDGVLPHVLKHAASNIPHDRVIWARSAQSLDQHIFHSSSMVISIAVLVGCVEDEEVAYLAVKLLTHIAESTFFSAADQFHGQYPGRMNRLLGLLDSSEESLLILGNFMGRLEAAASSFRDVDDGDFVVDTSGELEERDMSRISSAIRSAILDLLLQNTQPHRAAPNVAHYLLGFDARASKDTIALADPRSPDAKLSCFHAILDLLRMGQASRKSEENEVEFSLLERDPILAEKAHRVIRQLCLHEYSCKPVSRYLRNTEQYFIAQASALPLSIPANHAIAGGQLIMSSGKVVETTCSEIVATMHSTSWVLETISLELNILTQQTQRERATDLLFILFESSSSPNQSKSILDQVGSPDQSLPRMQELFLYLDFAWKNDTTIEPRPLNFFATLNFDQCCIIDSTGCQLFDLGAILSMLGATRQEIKRRGLLNTAAQQAEMQEEIKFVIESIVVENQRRQIASAQYHMLRSWSTLLRLTLSRAFHLVPAENRHIFLLDLLGSVLSKLVEGQVDSDSAELLSEIVVALMIKLRHEGTQLGSLATGEAAQAFPFDRMITILKTIVQSIVLSNTSNIIRGNLYASLLGFLQHVYATSNADSTASQSFSSQDIMKLADALVPSPDAASTVVSQWNSSRSTLETNTIAMISTAFDRLLPVLSKDAIMGSEVWKSVAFTALDSLLMLSDRSRSGFKLMAVLWRNGSMKNFVDFVKDAEADLLAVLEPDPESLNALYVYETQMAFLLRVASSQAGAEKLIDAQLLVRLGQCNYLSGSPQSLSLHQEFDMFIPSASERYHQLLLPALQLVAGVLISLGSESGLATREALNFINAQREMIMTCIRSAGMLTSSVGIQELLLITTILRIALPAVGDQEIASSTDFGALHTGILAIANVVCGSQAWMNNILPASELERENVARIVPGSNAPFTVFQEQIRDLGLTFESSILTYMRVASQRRARVRFIPVISPTLRPLESTNGMVGPGPTLGTTLSFLRDSTNLLEFTVLQTSSLTHRLNNWGKISREEVAEILAEDDEFKTHESDRKLQAKQKVTEAHTKSYARSVAILDMIDMTLSLFWRNASYYLQQNEMGDGNHGASGDGFATLPRSSSSFLGGPGSGSTTSYPNKLNLDLLSGKRSANKDNGALFGAASHNGINSSLTGNRFLSNNTGNDFDINIIKEECLEFIRPTFVKLQNIDLASGGFTKDAIRARKNYMEILIRSISSLLFTS
ncbi:hypothetical protein PTTG_01001 [Puccinia triticina 1-1 BBBD Race 1]|uniref:Nucleoporin Nup186/Nup192/Nup205 n=2 Tax=Puccinia triticina TaxID=208348 RepID=A0A180GUS8_PUCT1|nr:uncharacterized protein PtA15_3A768 [Puccinia triticina]OAV96557.1 hypothetical protein PTTG_01001 [Puccinia triticina 1-1 BBBD Race 1]WAQ83398.1 hypothetical protein PtA15_3A768 [Puccinia triticina]